MKYRSCLIPLFLLSVLPQAGATDREWRAFEKSFDHNPKKVRNDVERDLQQAQQRGDKPGQPKAIRKLAYVDPMYITRLSRETISVGMALARELQDDESLGWLLRAEVKRIALTLSLFLSLLLLGVVWFHLHRRAAAARRDAAHHKTLASAEAAANEAKRTFLANISHELRSPLNVILGFTRLLLRRCELPEDARQDIGIVYNNGQHLYTMINQVLDLSKIEAGRLTLNKTDFDLYALLDELDDMFTVAANQKGLHLLIENDPRVPQWLHADVLKLRQVLINLLNNAIKFTSEGSVALYVGLPEGQESVITFAVSDTGPGVAQAELEKLGSAFEQAQAGRAAKEGTGLGLAISASFVRLMGGGSLKFSSRIGAGGHDDNF